MTLIKSISGIRGTIGGPAGDTLNPLDVVLQHQNLYLRQYGAEHVRYR